MVSSQHYGFNGNQDVYGLGIRIGYYTQALSVWAANRFVPGEAPYLQSVNILFMVAMIFGTAFLCRDTSSTYAVEPFLLIQITYLVAYIGTNMYGVSLRRQDGQRKDSLPWVAPVKFQLMQGVCFIALDAFSIWYWFVGINQMKRTPTPNNQTMVYWLYTQGNLLGWVRIANLILCVPWILGRCFRFTLNAIRGYRNRQLEKVTEGNFMKALEKELRDALQDSEDSLHGCEDELCVSMEKRREEQEQSDPLATRYSTQTGKDDILRTKSAERSEDCDCKRSIPASMSPHSPLEKIELNEEDFDFSGPTRVNTVNISQPSSPTTKSSKTFGGELATISPSGTSIIRQPSGSSQKSPPSSYSIDALLSANTYLTRLYPPPSPPPYSLLRLPYTILTHPRSLPRIAMLIYHIPTYLFPGMPSPNKRRWYKGFFNTLTPQLPHLMTFLSQSYSRPPLRTWPALLHAALTYPASHVPTANTLGLVQRLHMTAHPPPPPDRRAIIGDAITTASIFIQLVISTELTIQWNYVNGVQSILPVGQLIPFSLGVGALVKVVWGAVFEEQDEGCRLVCREAERKEEWKEVSSLFFELVERQSKPPVKADEEQKEEKVDV